jgi:hypothetical protein
MMEWIDMAHLMDALAGQDMVSPREHNETADGTYEQQIHV